METTERERAAKSRILAAAERIGTVPAALRSVSGQPDERAAQYAEGVAELLEIVSPAPEPVAEELAPAPAEEVPALETIIADLSEPEEEPEDDGKKRSRKS